MKGRCILSGWVGEWDPCFVCAAFSPSLLETTKSSSFAMGPGQDEQAEQGPYL